MELIERLLAIMEKMGLTPSEFADKINVQRSSISHITTGRNKPSLELLLKVKEAFPNIESDFLFLGEGEMMKNESESINFKNGEKSTPTLFDRNTEEELELTKKVEENYIVRIVIFYNNGKFDEFTSN